MNVVVVFAHPSADSFGQAICSTAVSALESSGHNVSLMALYQSHFTAAMSREEWLAYHGDQPAIDPTVQSHGELVRKADALIFIYPTWWSGLPSIMKGWLERVLVSGVAFHFNKKDKVRPSLKQVRHLVGISTYGSPHTYITLMNDNGRRIIMRALRVCTGWRTKRTWLGMYNMGNSTSEQRDEFLQRVHKTLRELS
ncbi:MAG: NAD(P)H-dependent oxidoreductase [Actinomycetes bacterium]|jgi:NAD(P)H-dependent FMN reductase